MIPTRALQRTARASHILPLQYRWLATQHTVPASALEHAYETELRTLISPNYTSRCQQRSNWLSIKPSWQERSFSSSSCLYKKGNKAAKATVAQSEPLPSSKSSPADDPLDFTILEAEIASSLEVLKTNLSKLRTGGRFNPELLENLRVQPDKNSNETVKLNDLAQVIPKGRTVQILVSEKEYIKSVTTAIISSRTLNPSLTPQPDPTGTNPLLLILNIPPPTAESRKAAVNEAVKAGEKAGAAVRDARARQQKKLRAAEKVKSVRPDDLKKAGTQMEKVVEKGQGEVKRVVDSAKKVLENE